MLFRSLKIRKQAFNNANNEECPFERPLEVCMDKGLLPHSKPKRKLHVPIYEYFYLTKEEYESDLRFLDKIYEDKEPSDLKIENSWIWGRYLWIEEYRKFGSNLAYKTLCQYSRKTEVQLQSMLLIMKVT